MRKREYAKEKNTVIRFRANDEDKLNLQQYCKTNNIDMSSLLLNYVRKIVSINKNIKISL